MKKVLITGAGSYIGKNLLQFLAQWPREYRAEAISVRDDSWKAMDFSSYDVIVHTAGIVHEAQSKNDPAQRKRYDCVNTELPLALAEKARREGVTQFLFFSTMAVYGLTAAFGQQIIIDDNTPCTPCDYYGSSKLEAEKGLQNLASEQFRVAILRPPMIYGKGCKGNYVTLSRLAQKMPVMPKLSNQRSMLYIGNLTLLVKHLMDDRAAGIFCPQDARYVSTCDMMACIADCHQKKLHFLPGTAPLLRLLPGKAKNLLDKAFGSLCYTQSLSSYPKEYQIYSLDTAVKETES